MKEYNINVTMFKCFTVQIEDKVMDTNDIKSDKLVKLFAYLLYHHKRNILSSELEDMLWMYEEVNNPLGALKNLIYRLRVLLKNYFFIDDFIMTGSGTYSINKDYCIHIDTLEFEKMIDKPKTEKDYQNILSLYKGKYMIEITDDHRIITKRSYYHSLFIDDMIDYAYQLKKQQDYLKMEKVLRQVINIEQYEESLYRLLIESLYYQKHYHEAMKMYKETIAFLHKTLGIKPSQEMIELCHLLQKENCQEVDIVQIQKDIQENSPGAFDCEFETFKDICKIQARLMGRLGYQNHVCLLSLNTSDHQYINEIEKYMQMIHKALSERLRKGDVFSRIGKNQFAILLPCCDYEDTIMVIDRVLRKPRYRLNKTCFYIDICIEELKVRI
ncbi:MAG: BTAD domain-containing putative transcriptional regulator [Longibaculum sp.]